MQGIVKIKVMGKDNFGMPPIYVMVKSLKIHRFLYQFVCINFVIGHIYPYDDKENWQFQ